MPFKIYGVSTESKPLHTAGMQSLPPTHLCICSPDIYNESQLCDNLPRLCQAVLQGHLEAEGDVYNAALVWFRSIAQCSLSFLLHSWLVVDALRMRYLVSAVKVVRSGPG